MSGSSQAGEQLYAQFAGLLAPTESLDGTSSLVILEPAGKDVAALDAAAGSIGDEALSDLVNAIPAAAPTFLDTGRSYDDVWGLVLTGASPTGEVDDPVRVNVAKLVADNRADYELMARVRGDVPADTYRPVRAVPEDWLDAGGWTQVSFRIGADEPPPPPPPMVTIPEKVPDLVWRTLASDVVLDPGVLSVVRAAPAEAVAAPRAFELLRAVRVAEAEPVAEARVVVDDAPARMLVRDRPGLARRAAAVRLRPRGEEVVPEAGVTTVREPLRWRELWSATRAIEQAAAPTPATPPSSGFTLSFDYRVVSLVRPWLRSELCHFVSGWQLPGFAAGGLSNGKPSGNDGLMPVITTRMLVVRNLAVAAHWADADAAKAAATATGTLSFGPFSMTGDAHFDGSTMTRPAPQVVAWLATVVPTSPPT